MIANRPHLFQSFQVVSARIRRWILSWTLATLLVLSPVPISFSAETEETAKPNSVAVLVSAYRPFLEAVEGLSSVLETAGAEVELFTLEDYPERRRAVLRERMIQPSFECYIGVGPWAADFIWRELDRPSVTALYTMVYNPEKRLPPTRDLCGVSMNIPIPTQVETILTALPDARRVGLMYDPQFNDPFFIQAKQIAERLDRRIVPLQVSSSKEIPTVLKKHLNDIDALWLIIDETVTSLERIVQFIIETALSKRVPVIGYNRFHYESGTALSFILDYEALGEQTGHLFMETLRSGVCQSPDPEFTVLVNPKVIERLDIQLGDEISGRDVTQP
jgi:putative ABC transport system substrate-binding protein